jgi:U3 small nucleolar RNA-associated protein 20
MLLHPHSWLRNISVRLIALYFKCVKDVNKENHQSSLSNYFLMNPSRLYLIAISICCQLKRSLIDEAGSSLMTQNIVFAILGFHSLMGQTACIDPPAFWSTLEQHEKNRFLKALTLINARKRARMFESSSSLNSCASEDSNQLTDRTTQYRLVSLLLRAMGKIALETDVIQVGTQSHCIYVF